MKKTLFTSVVILAALAAQAQSTWTPVNSGTLAKLEAVCMPSQNTVLAGGLSGTLLRSTDYGNTFATVSTGIADDVKAIQFFNANDGYLLIGNTLMNSADGGATWNIISTVPGNPKAIYFVNPMAGYVAADGGAAYATTDGGLTWNPLVTGLLNRLDAVWFNSATEGFFGGRNQASLHTSTGGSSFTSNVIPANGDVKDIHFVSAQSGYSCGDNGEVLFTSDGGNTWSAQVTPNTAVDMNALHFTDAQNGWCSGEAGTLFHTSDGGATWISDITNTTQELNNVYLFDSNHGFAVGNVGTLIRLGSGPAATVAVARNKMHLLVSPNPVNRSAVLLFELPEASAIMIRVKDLLGNDVLRKEAGYFAAGKNGLGLDCSGLNSGVYMVTIQSPARTATARIILQN